MMILCKWTHKGVRPLLGIPKSESGSARVAAMAKCCTECAATRPIAAHSPTTVRLSLTSLPSFTAAARALIKPCRSWLPFQNRWLTYAACLASWVAPFLLVKNLIPLMLLLWSRRRPSPSPWLPSISACSTRWPCGSVEHEIKCPCQLLDEASWHDQKAPPSPTAKPFLHPEGDPGGHAFLAAKPAGMWWPTWTMPFLWPKFVTAEMCQKLLVTSGTHSGWLVGKNTLPHSCAWRHFQMGGPSRTKGRKMLVLNIVDLHGLWFGHHGPTAAAGQLLSILSRPCGRSYFVSDFAERRSTIWWKYWYPSWGIIPGTLELLQELCVLMRSHRARAVLRRRAELTGWSRCPLFASPVWPLLGS